MLELTPIVIALFGTTAINIAVSITSWRRRNSKSGLYFAVGMSALTFWTLMSALDYGFVALQLKILFATLEAWGYVLGLTFFTMFSFSFVGFDHWLQKKWVQGLFIFVAASDVLLVSTNSLHGWVWRDFIRATDNIVVFVHGPAFSWIVFNCDLMALAIIVNFSIASLRGSEFSKRQGRLLLFSMVFALGTNIAYQMRFGGVEGVDWTSLTFSVIGVLFLWALYGQRLLDIVPIARSKVISNLMDGMVVLDIQGRIVDINAAAADMLGTPQELLLGKMLGAFLPQAQSFLKQPLESEAKIGLEFGDGNKRHFDALLSPLRDRPDKIIGRLIIFRNITERKEAEVKLQHAHAQLEEKVKDIEELQIVLREKAVRDWLTHLHNRYYLSETLSRELARAQREAYPVSFALIDVDHFKDINDTHGHAAGDTVLKHIASQLLKFTRTGDIVCRYGGEEFLVVMPNTRSADAVEIAERLRHSIQESEVRAGTENKIFTSISVGISEFPSSGADEASALNAADKALYSAKFNGRNQVVLFRKSER